MTILKIDETRIPKHVAIVMDGNGRWAKARNLERTVGHQEGIKSVREIAETAARIGVKYLTLYTFSMENWHRPLEEVSALMGLLMYELNDKIFKKNKIRFDTIGDINRLPKNIQEQIQVVKDSTACFDRMTLVLALSYSSRWEITNATKKIAKEVAAGTLSLEQVDESCVSNYLGTYFMPDPDLLIRTGGDLRLSNYLLWQSAYTEFYFSDIYWPDFRELQFREAIVSYQHRERRFGKISEQIQKS